MAGRRDIVLLLTATIDPDGMSYTARSDPGERARDYQWALRKWLKCGWLSRIFLCENTGADLTFLARIAPSNQQRLTLHSFEGNTYPRHLGKGVGEVNIIREALQSMGEPPGLVVKVAGRYYVRNLRQLLHALDRAGRADVCCNMYGTPWVLADSRLFFATPEFLQRFLIPLQHRINDSETIHFEHILAEAAAQAIASGFKWAPLPYTPVIEGISGTANLRIDTRGAARRYALEVGLNLLNLRRFADRIANRLKL